MTAKNLAITQERVGRWPGPWLTRLFGKPELIDGGGACPAYLARWIIGKLPSNLGKVYIHAFYDQDWSKDLHDHPKRFTSIGLWGTYAETIFVGTGPEKAKRIYSAPWIRTFAATHAHRVSPITETVWTLVHVGGASRDWGFFRDGTWKHWREYVKSGEGRARKSCPD